MGENSKIEWCHHTFNPWIGCTKVAAGCTHCYAEAFAKRTAKAQWGPLGTRVRTSGHNWRLPIKWNTAAAVSGERARVFCASLADVFEDWTGNVIDHRGSILSACNVCGHVDRIDSEDGFWEQGQNAAGADLFHCPACADDTPATLRPGRMSDLRANLFRLIDQTPWLDWLLLTKRPGNIQRFWPLDLIDGTSSLYGWKKRRNVWLLTSIAEQKDADTNIPDLLKYRDLVPVLGLSCEPLVGPVDISPWLPGMDVSRNDRGNDLGSATVFDGVDWVICGGESGHHSRPIHPHWARSLRDQCHAAGVPFLFKQWGEWIQGDAEPGGDLGGDVRAGRAAIVPRDRAADGHFRRGDVIMRKLGKKAAGRDLDGRTWDEYPEVQHAE